MSSDTERRAVQAHAEKIAKYEKARRAEEGRLRAPKRERMEEIGRRLHQIPDNDGRMLPRLAVNLDQKKKLDDLHEENRERAQQGKPLLDPPPPPECPEQLELSAWDQKVEAGLKAFDHKHKPAIEPWDTPEKILQTISQIFNWTDAVQTLAAEDGEDLDPAWRPPDWIQLNERELVMAYRSLRQRVRAFARLAPSVLTELPEAHDPGIGIERIREWCVEILKDGQRREALVDDPFLTVTAVCEKYEVDPGNVRKWCAAEDKGYAVGARKLRGEWHIPAAAEHQFPWPPRPVPKKRPVRLAASETFECMNCKHEVTSAKRPPHCEKCRRIGSMVRQQLKSLAAHAGARSAR